VTFNTLKFETADGVATLTLNRPEAANAIDLEMGRDLLQAAIQCDEDPSIRAVVLQATGKMFCAGGDVKFFAGAGDDLPSVLKELTIYLHGAVSRFGRMRAPLIAAVHATAAGAGFSLAAAADFVLAARSARFVMAYTGIGFSPDGGSTYVLPRLVGARRAAELMITNRVLSAQEALDWGLVNRVVEDDHVHEEAHRLARTLAAGPTEAYGAVKRLLLSSAQNGFETQMELEAQAIAAVSRTEDARGAIRAFVEKRKPGFTGRQ
jgi:2-(1,2-epoxy-1,2-dihydrophenyl)acetyl-CoA isomerase